jgi:hypothetical protein
MLVNLQELICCLGLKISHENDLLCAKIPYK